MGGRDTDIVIVIGDDIDVGEQEAFPFYRVGRHLGLCWGVYGGVALAGVQAVV